MEEISAWDWIYGKTPKFSVHRTFSEQIDDNNIIAKIDLEIVKGCIANPEIIFEMPYGNTCVDERTVLEFKVDLQGVKYSRGTVASALTQVKMKWISQQQYHVESHRLLDWLLMCVMETTGLFYNESLSHGYKGNEDR